MGWFSSNDDDDQERPDGGQQDDRDDQEFRDAWLRMEPWAYRSGRG